MVASTQRVDWFFGRGLSIGCGLPWSVPLEWRQLPREEQIRQITAALRAEMDGPNVDCADINTLIDLLSQRTVNPWRHLFYTTNWDYLLQREILKRAYNRLPDWCANTHVFHLNGTIEELPDNQHRSPFLLETDPSDQRTSTVEANKAFEKMIWNRHFVVVGMSFECDSDKFLLRSLARVEDNLPIGESDWILVNPDSEALSSTCKRVQAALPHARIQLVPTTLRQWLGQGTPQLQLIGALAG